MNGKFLSLAWISLFFCASIGHAQTLTIKGVVRDQQKAPLAGASILVKGTGTGVSTDSLGRFQLNVKPTAVLVISAIGYLDTSLRVRDLDDQSKIDLVMQADPKLLKEATVKASSTGSQALQMETLNQQIVGSTISTYRETQNLYTGTTLHEELVQNGKGGTLIHSYSSTPNGTVYTGAAIPVFGHKEETKGTRYLFEKWVLGTVIDSAGNQYNPKNFIYNYDKVTRNLLLTQDMNQVVEVDKDIIRSFTLKGEDRDYVFERVKVIDPSNCLEVLVKPEGKYGLYKYVKVRFVKSDYHTDGMVESGNPYDEYVDESRYFILYPDGTTFHELTMRMKALRDLLANEAGGKAAAFLKEHRYDPVNPALLVALVTAMNQ